MAQPLRTLLHTMRNLGATVVAAPATGVLVAAMRYRDVGWTEQKARQAAGEPAIYAIWHNSVMLGLGHPLHRGTAVLVSPGSDGTFAARTVAPFGVRSVRGSTGRRGFQGARALLAAARDQERTVVVTPDGPRGPRYSVQPGIIWLAARSGRPIVPIALAVTRAWHTRSWDRLRIPKPFSRCEVVFGAPRAVPSTLRREVWEAERAGLEAAMHEVSAEAARRAGVAWPD